MAYYVIHDSENKGLVVQADSRSEARSVGEKVSDARISAAVREDEGATITETEKKFASTTENPYKFVENVLH